MRYIGGKSLLLEEIDNVVNKMIGWENVKSCIDIFSGSGIVSSFFKEKGCNVLSNDFLTFSFVISRGTTGINKEPSFCELGFDPLEYLNNIDIENTNFSTDELFMYNNYSPHDDCERMYFQNNNAKKIDIIRLQIEKWYKSQKINEDEYFYLLASLLLALPYVANITGVYAAYLKFWDKRTYNDIHLSPPTLLLNHANCTCTNLDYKELLECEKDLLYADPPYNAREYLPNYHIMETVAKYDYPAIHGKTGMRDYKDQKSPFCKKKLVTGAFESLIRDTNCKHILISYNNEGLIDTETLSEICQDYAKDDSFRLFEFPYRRYKNKIPNNTAGLKEQLYYLRKK